MNVISDTPIKYSNCGGCGMSNADGKGLSKLKGAFNKVASSLKKKPEDAPADTTAPAPPAAPAPSPATPAPPKDNTMMYVGIGAGVIVVGIVIVLALKK